MSGAFNEAWKNLGKSALHPKLYYRKCKGQFSVGDWVWVYHPENVQRSLGEGS